MNRKTYLAPQFRQLLLIGTGGTGSYLAQGLAKLVAGYRLELEVLMVDPDVVEEKNCARQNFQPWEVGQAKAEALALRLNQQYGVGFGFLQAMGEDQFGGYPDAYRLIVSCVDTIAARKPCKGQGPWLDLGNGQETGQALYGTTDDRKLLAAEVNKWETTPHVGHLPSPYRVAGMGRLRTGKRQPSCADTPFAEQGIFANEWAASAGLAILHQLLIKGELSTPAIYFDTAKPRVVSGFVTRDMLTC
jgi:PRTRC genetic system ThiF family protein